MTDSEIERLAFLAEELAECVQQVGKILRHGYESHNPVHPELGDNRSQLEKEIGQVVFVVDLMYAALDIDRNKVEEWAKNKSRHVWQWLHYQDEVQIRYEKQQIAQVEQELTKRIAEKQSRI